MVFLASCVVFAALMIGVQGDGQSYTAVNAVVDRALKAACRDLRPRSDEHSRGFQVTGNGGFVIKSDLVNELNGKYALGQEYEVDLLGLANQYEGFVIQARDRWSDDLILGSFTPLNPVKAMTMDCLGNDKGTVTHKTKDPVSILSFRWQAPATLKGSGEVEFMYSVVQSFSLSDDWIGLRATFPKRSARGAAQDSSCPPPPAPDALYPFTFTVPSNCTQPDCDLFLGSRVNDNDPTYLDFMLEGTAQGWIAFGVSNVSAADIVGCVIMSETSVVNIIDSWNAGYGTGRDYIQNICIQSASYNSNRIQCSFSRQIITNDTAQDLPLNEDYYFLYGRGDTTTDGVSLPKNASFVMGDSVINVVNATSVSASSEDSAEHSILVRVHCVLMVAGLSIFGPIGIFFSAWMKPVLSKKAVWFQLHRCFMLAMLFLGTVGFICIFVSQRGSEFNGHYGLIPLDNPGGIVHFVFGITIMAMMVANPLISLLRCHADAPRRWIYNLFHGVIIGLLFTFLVLANTCVGIYLLVDIGTMFYIYLAFAIFTVVINILLGIMILIVSHGHGDLPALARLISLCLSSNSTPSSKKQETIQMEELHKDKHSSPAQPSATCTSKQSPPPSSRVEHWVRWGAFIIYIAVSIPLMIAVIVLITMTSPD